MPPAACTTSCTGAPVSFSSSAGDIGNTPCGWPAAAHTWSKRNSSRSIRVTTGVACASGDTPPIVKPVLAFTNSASARPMAPTICATFFSSTRRSPDATTRIATSSDLRRKTTLLAICPTADAQRVGRLLRGARGDVEELRRVRMAQSPQFRGHALEAFGAVGGGAAHAHTAAESARLASNARATREPLGLPICRLMKAPASTSLSRSMPVSMPRPCSR